MAEKATLLQELPPVAKESPSGNTAKSVSSAGTEVQPDKEHSISAFQAVTYGSFVLSFILAGFAAVVLYRKAIGDIEQRIVRSAKVLASVLAVMAMHGFFATYVYTNYLRNETDSAPISLTVLIWIILGATTGYVSNRLIELKDRLKTSDAVVDAIFYAVIFVSVTLAVSAKIGPNAALILSLLAVILCVVPFSRFFTACKRIKFNRKGAKRKPGRSILYTLVSLPTLVPFFAILYVAELFGPDLTLFFINAVSITLICYISFAMLSQINNTIEKEAGEASGASEAAPTATPAAAPAGTTGKACEPAPAPTMDPLVAELLAEEEAAKQQAAPAPQAQPATPDIVPPAKPGKPKTKTEQPQKAPTSEEAKPQPPAPKPPGQEQKKDESPAPGSNLKVKPPSKPKKRF